jgi:polyisoprenoid-binding protein YceI
MVPGRFGACCILLSGLASLGGQALPTPPREPPAADETLRIDGARSEARFLVRLRIGMRTEGRISKVSGELQGEPARGWQVLVVADGRSLVVKGPRWMDRSTRSPQFLDVDAHPEIRFQSERFSDQLLHAGGRIRGRLTLRGLTQPVSFRLLPSACDHPGRDCDMQVNGTIDRKKFGMTAHPLTVRDDVELHMRVRLLGPAAASPK